MNICKILVLVSLYSFSDLQNLVLFTEKTEKFTLTLNHLDLDKNDTVSISSLSQPHKPVLQLNTSFSSLAPVEMSSVNGAYVVIKRNKCAQANRTVAAGSLSGVLGECFGFGFSSSLQ